jgi:hypothetical protein
VESRRLDLVLCRLEVVNASSTAVRKKELHIAFPVEFSGEFGGPGLAHHGDTDLARVGQFLLTCVAMSRAMTWAWMSSIWLTMTRVSGSAHNPYRHLAAQCPVGAVGGEGLLWLVQRYITSV